MATGMGECQVLYGASFANEVVATTPGGTVRIGVHAQLEGVVLISGHATELADNAVTNASGFSVVRAYGQNLGSTTLIKSVNPFGTTVQSSDLSYGDGTRGGKTAFTALASFSLGEAIAIKFSPVKLTAGDALYMQGTTTAASATGDWIPCYIVRMGGVPFESTRVLAVTGDFVSTASDS